MRNNEVVITEMEMANQTRLSDEAIASIDSEVRAVRAGDRHPVAGWECLAMAAEIMERRSLDETRASEIAELVERRKADLSAEEVSDLRKLRNAARVLLWTWDGTGEDPRDAIRRSFAVLDRLTGAPK